MYVTHDKASDFCQLDPITGKSQWCQSPIATNNPMEAVSNQTTLYIASPTGVSALQKNNGKVSWVYKDKTFGAVPDVDIWSLAGLLKSFVIQIGSIRV